MPLSMSNLNEEYKITHVGGRPKIRKHLEDLGFVVGSNVSVVAFNKGNAIVNIKGSRVAISDELVNKIHV